MIKPIQIGISATVELRPGNQWVAKSKIVITDDFGRKATLTLKNARELYAALRTLDREGLLK